MYTQLNKKNSWTNNEDYILKKGEPGYDIKNKILKIGNGKDAWKNLSPAISLSLTEGYEGAVTVIEDSTNLGDEAVAAVYFQGKALAELLPGQKATLLTTGETMQNNIEVIANKELAVYIPLWDGSYTAEEGVVSAPYIGEFTKEVL
jgi:hypothetical protein